MFGTSATRIAEVHGVFVAQAHSFTQQARLAITLAWVAGYTNIVALITCGTMTSHVTGTLSHLGMHVAEGRFDLAIFWVFLLLMFLSGAFLSALCTETGRRRGWESIYVLPMVLEAMLMTAFAIGVELHDHRTIETGAMLFAMTGVASIAMGLQNATITRISSGVVRTTHMTGVFTDLGLESVQFLYWLRDRRRDPKAEFKFHPSGKRLALLASVAGSFALGAALGTAAYSHFPRWAMFPPVLFLLWVIYQDLRRPICEIEPSDLESTSGLDLPEDIAVYHLRRDSRRRGKAHRLPNLLAWSERLPPGKRVVILDLGDVTEVDENSALEFRALVRQFHATGRRLVIAGLTRDQYRALRASAGGDAFDHTSVCPDLDLAIARGLTLLDSPP